MLNILVSVLFGIVEGITEWLPVSSTGHMIILNNLVPFDVSADFYKVYEVVIQLGAIMAVVILFFGKIWPFGKSDNPVSDKGLLKYCKKDIWILWFKILVACVPAAVVGLVLDDWIDEHFYNPICVALALIVVGIAFIVVECVYSGKKAKIKTVKEITFNTAFLIGIFQLLAAIFPGTSRSGATIIGALLLGVGRVAAAEFTFYLAIPVMAGASLLKLLKYVLKFGFAFTSAELMILGSGTLVAFVVSLLVIKVFLGFIRKHDFIPFGIYRIVMGLIVLVYFYAL